MKIVLKVPKLISFVMLAVAAMTLVTFSYGQNSDDASRYANVKSLFDESEKAAKAGNPEEALRLITEASKKEPEFYAVWMSRGIVLMNMEKYDEAINNMSKAIELKPEMLGQYGLRGMAYYELERYDDAIEDLTRALAEESDSDSDFLQFRGLSYFRTEQCESSIKDWNMVIKLRPKNPLAYSVRGQCFLRQHQFQRAVDDFTHLIKIDPKYMPAYLLRGYALHEMEKDELAVADFEVAATDKSIEYEARVVRAQILTELKKYREAKSELDKCISLNPDSDGVFVALSYLAFNLYDTDKLIEYSAKALEIDPKSAMAHNNIAYAYLLQDKLDLARKEIDAALALDGELTLAINNRGLLAIRQKRFDEALVDVKRVIELDPELPEGYLNRGYINFGQKKYQAAIDDFTMALEKKNDHILALEARALAYKKLGKIDLAKADSDEAARLKNEFAKLRKEVFGDEK